MTSSSSKMARVGDGFGDQSGIEASGKNLGHERARIARAELHGHLWIRGMELAQRPWQPRGCGALHRAEPQHATRPRLVQGVPRFVGQRQHALGIADEHPACRRQLQALALTKEKVDAELFFELPDPRRHIRLHPMQALRRAGYAACLHDGEKDVQVRGFNISHCEIIPF